MFRVLVPPTFPSLSQYFNGRKGLDMIGCRFMARKWMHLFNSVCLTLLVNPQMLMVEHGWTQNSPAAKSAGWESCSPMFPIQILVLGYPIFWHKTKKMMLWMVFIFKFISPFRPISAEQFPNVSNIPVAGTNVGHYECLFVWHLFGNQYVPWAVSKCLQANSGTGTHVKCSAITVWLAS